MVECELLDGKNMAWKRGDDVAIRIDSPKYGVQTAFAPFAAKAVRDAGGTREGIKAAAQI
ncbi:MAG: hypothetical protein DRJ03_00185 [Chloroflexi bacterium]|nr:MAG: hypothetical protein DRJ03_00185 [Chloroflexota bacterium]